MKQFLTVLLACIVVLTMVDHMMRLDWANQCKQGDQITCPDKLWWFQSGCETDSECIAIAGVHPLEGN